MIKNPDKLATKLWWHLCFLILINIPVVQVCSSKKSTPNTTTPKPSQGQSSIPCTQNITTDLHQPIFAIVQQRNVCPYTDMCLRITTGTVSDYARLYYPTVINASKEILHGYLVCGGDGVSVTGTSPRFQEFYVTLISSRPRENNIFFVDEIGNTKIVSLRNNVSFDENYALDEQADTHYSPENNVDLSGNQIDFDDKYGKLPMQGFKLNIIAFYDTAFKTECNQTTRSPDNVIEQIFNHVKNFFKHDSLPTKFYLNPIKKIYKSDVVWNNAKENGTATSLMKLNIYDEENADVFVHLGVMNFDDTTLGKVPEIGKCFSNNLTCSGLCSLRKFERGLVVESDVNDLPKTAYIITHEIGHLLGLKHDFWDTTDIVPYLRPKHSVVDMKSCTNVNGIMDYGNTEHNNLKWSNCSIEYLRIYHQRVKDFSTHNNFCLETYSHTTTVDHIDDQPLELVCDIRQCGGDDVIFVKWYLKGGEFIGSYSPIFGDTTIQPQHSNNINMVYKEEKVTLRVSTFTSTLQNTYCLIDAETTKTFCERKQTFEINAPVNCQWSSWNVGSCTQTCGGGALTKTRSKAVEEANGGTCQGQPSETEICNPQNCPVNCEWSAWTNQMCTKTCGSGSLFKSRTKTVTEAYGGSCSGQATETETCNPNRCPVNCLWGTWNSWNSCSKTCGGGDKTTTRGKIINEFYGGTCTGLASKTESCNTDSCPVDHLLVIGGNDGRRYLSEVEMINLGTQDKICQPLQLEYPVDDHSSVVTSRGVITCGGYNGTTILKTCTLQTKEGETKPFPSMIRSRGNFGMVVMDQSLIVVGGSGASNKMEKIGLNDNEWVEEDLPFRVWNHCVVSINKTMMMAIGGEDANWNILDTTWIYDSSKNQWTKGPALIEKRDDHSCFYDDQSNSVFVIGGWNRNGRLKSTEKLKLNENINWESTIDLPEPLSYSAAVASNSNEVIGYVAGGRINNGSTDKIWGLRRTDLNWMEMPKRLQIPRQSHSMVNIASDEIPGC